MISDATESATTELLRRVDGPHLRPAPRERMELGGEDAKRSLGKLALAIIELIHQLLERQAIRRLDEGTITEEQLERVGEGLMRQSEALDELCEEFGVARSELNLDLGPLGNLL